MDNNNSHFTGYEDESGMDNSLFLPLPADPIMIDDDDIITPSYTNSVDGEMAFLVLPAASPPCMPPPTPQSPLPVSPLPVYFTVVAQSSPPATTTTASRKRKPRKSNKVPKAKATPKYKINPDDCETEEEKISVLHAIKCRKGRLRKAQEQETLMQTNAELKREVLMLTEQLRDAMGKIEALEREVERHGREIMDLTSSASP